MPTEFELEEINIESWPFSITGIAYGEGIFPLEVIYSNHNLIPTPSQLRSAWRSRQEGRGIPLLVIVLHNDKAFVCGPSGEEPPVFVKLDTAQIESVCKEALEQPSRQTALGSLRDSLGSLQEEGIPGLRNEGFLATHELTYGVPKRNDWNEALDKTRPIIRNTGNELLTSLGYGIERLDRVTNVLTVAGENKAVAILLTENETPESGSDRFPGMLSPISHAFTVAEEKNFAWVFVIHGRKIRIYPLNIGIAVGRRGRTETYLECHTGLIPDNRLAYLWLIFSADALADGGSLKSIIEDSKDFAGDLASRLRERIYEHVIPLLSTGIAYQLKKKNHTAQLLDEIYQMAMTVLFRMLFIAYGEDKDLLPYRFNSLYKENSLKTIANELLELMESKHEFGSENIWWKKVQAIFEAIENGNSAWGIPAYKGGLFASNQNESEIGTALQKVSLPDYFFGPALQSLLLVETAEGVMGPVDFRSLGVREFGTIYEGLLESELSVAETDLKNVIRGKHKDSYIPCLEGEDPSVRKGKIYLHNSSGTRKSTGSYYTKHFAVEHLLDKSLEIAIDHHFKFLDSLDELEASEAFFDFKVADIAMGSGHFLVAAVDRIESRFSNYLSNRNLPLVFQELAYLRKSAIEALGETVHSYPEIEDNSLLRRQIARRCIYGIDINEVAVQLSRVALWIHTFVPGLPLSLLERNLTCGNSLIGIGKLSEFEEKLLEDGTETLFSYNVQEMFLGSAQEDLARIGKISEANQNEINDVKKAWRDSDESIASAKVLCDILTAARIEKEELPLDFTHWSTKKKNILESLEHKKALEVIGHLNPFHFPVSFPEVFLRKKDGFDVIIGNPPWEEVTVEEHGFWARYSPGHRGLNQREREVNLNFFRETRPDLVSKLEDEVAVAESLRKALVNGPFPGMGSGDPDLYKAFCWRFWFLASEKYGQIGVVLPRSTISAKGSTEFRKKLFTSQSSFNITTLVNNKNWVFDEGHPQWTYALIAINKVFNAKTQIELSGPYNSLSTFENRKEQDVQTFQGDEVLGWNDTASLPLLPTENSFVVFKKMRENPRLDLDEPREWRARAYRELDATNDKKDKNTGQVLMDLESADCPEGFWPIFKGESFDLWQPDKGKGSYYAWGHPEVLRPRLQAKRVYSQNMSSSVFNECNSEWCENPDTLPCLYPRIAFRDVTRATDTRTIRCALIPPNVFIANQAPYFVFPRGNKKDVTYLLGILSSIPLDWYSRRFVETHASFFIINSFPIPRPDKNNTLRKRVIGLAGRLACPDERFSEWAKEVGVECGPLEEDKKQDMIEELDAVVAHLYDLSEDHLTHIFETFHVGWNYHAKLEATLKHYQHWSVKK